MRQVLFGSEIVKACPGFFNNYVEKIAEILNQNLNFEPNDPSTMACYNNAIFAVGEFALAYRQSFRKYIPDFAKNISQILAKNPKVSFLNILSENSSSYIEH